MMGIGACPLKVGSGSGVIFIAAGVGCGHETIFMLGQLPWMQNGSSPNSRHRGAAGQIKMSRQASTPRIIPLMTSILRFITYTRIIRLMPVILC